MIGEGLKVRFIPTFARNMHDTIEELAEKTITGTICYINWEHQNFTVEFDCGGTKQKESFRFWEIGKAVKVIG